MTEGPTLIYLETDDEITTVVRRMRAADPGHVVIVAPGRSRATSSTVALRLLARAAEEDGRTVSVVGDALTRSLAAEAGLAAYGSVDDARRADPGASPAQAEVRTAAIHVVRGSAHDDTAPTLTAVAAATRDADTAAVPVTRPRPPQPARRRPPARRTGRRRVPAAAALAAALAILVAWGAVAALVLPAATITITTRSEPIGPDPDVIAIADVERVSGTVTDTATVTATGSYDINVPALGLVTFLNYNFDNVHVAADSLVATGQEEGDQAFTTDEAITVPAGEFDPFFGGITAGEASVAVTAAASGPGGNVAAEAIDTVLDPNLANQLRGFPTVDERFVTNPEPTSGGETGAGVEITEDDVRAAESALREELMTAAADAHPETESRLVADQGEQIDIAGLDDLIGRRDAETVDIRGSLTYDLLTCDPADVDAIAIERLQADVRPGWQLMEDSVTVEHGEVLAAGEGMSVKVTVRGRVIPIVERDAVLDAVIGLSGTDAVAELADIGSATVELWPFWVGTVPDSDWRIELEVLDP